MHPRVGNSPVANGAEANPVLVQRLRELPPERVPPFDWAELQRRARSRGVAPGRTHDPRALPRRAILVAAALASVVAAALLAGHLIRGAGVATDRERTAGSPSDQERTPRNALPADAGRDADLVLRRAAAAERWLASQPEDEPIVRVSTHLVVTDLEDRIASVDDLLNVERLRKAHARVHALQLERAQLVDSLAQVRYAEMLTTEPP